MATGDWSFPREGCSCIRFKTQLTKRPWIGCQLWPFATEFAATRRYFLNVFQEYSATPIWTAQTFTGAWDISKEHYGDFAATGSTPNPVIFNFYSKANQVNCAPYVTTHGTGNYVFAGGVSGLPADAVQLISFAAAASTTIRITEQQRLFYGPLNGFPPTRAQADFTITRIWSNELTPALMDARLRDDLQNEVPYIATPINVTYPRNFVIPNIGENLKPWARGGMAEFTDYNSAVGLYSREGIVPDTTVDFEAGGYGHAHSWQSRLLTQGSFPDGYGTHLYPASLSRCKIYQPGRHSIVSKSLTDGSVVVNCQAFDVECPAVSQSELLLIPPPEKDREKKEIYFNRTDCTFPPFGGP